MLIDWNKIIWKHSGIDLEQKNIMSRTDYTRFISSLISFLLCAWFYFRADTSFATVDPGQQKINISIVGQKICFGNAKKVGEIIILLVVKTNERKNNRT